MTVRTAIHSSVPLSALPDFTPVPRKIQRHDGWTPARQRAFIEALADTGCVAIAARMVNMSQASVYQLRRQPGAESFRAAMDAAQSLGLQVCKDEAFDRAMNGQLIPVFVAGKLMGFRRKKNDRLLMFILRHYGHDAQGRKTTINYFSTRATAGAAAPSGRQPTQSGALTSARDAGSDRPTTGEAVSIDVTDSLRDDAFSLAEASTTTVKTVITGPHQGTTLTGGISGGDAPTQLDADEAAANVLNAFQGVDLDPEAQDQIHRALAACAERRRALEDDPANDPERFFIGEAETNGYLGELESGVEGDWVEYRPEGEHLWENLGEGGQAAEIDKVLAEIEARRAARTPEEIAAEKAEDEAEVRRMREQRALPTPMEPDPSLPRTGSGDPRLDWRNWGEGGYTPPPPTPSLLMGEDEASQALVRGTSEAAHGEGDETEPPAPISPRREHRPRKPYRKRTPKPHFKAPDGEKYEARKAKAIAAVTKDRRTAAEAAAERRKAKEKERGRRSDPSD